MKLIKLFELPILIFLILVAAVLGYKLFIENSYDKSATDKKNIQVSNFNLQNEKAAEKGAAWLIKHNSFVKPELSNVYLINLYKIANNSELATQLEKIIKENSEKITIGDTKFDSKNNKYLDWNNLKDIFYSIERKKCKGEDYKEDLKQLDNFLTGNKDKIFTEKITLSQKLLYAYQLREMGIGLDNYYSSLINKIRLIYPNLSNLVSSKYYENLNILITLVFAESNYFEKYLDPKSYSLEVAEINKAIDKASSTSVSTEQVTMISKILIASKILKIMPNTKIETLYSQLINSQNSDGSWGKGKDVESSFILTSFSTLALIDSTTELRKAKNYCFY